MIARFVVPTLFLVIAYGGCFIGCTPQQLETAKTAETYAVKAADITCAVAEASKGKAAEDVAAACKLEHAVAAAACAGVPDGGAAP